MGAGAGNELGRALAINITAQFSHLRMEELREEMLAVRQMVEKAGGFPVPEARGGELLSYVEAKRRRQVR